MTTDNDKDQNEKSDSLAQPDPKTKNTTDPQEHMEGPISSLMQKTEETFSKEDSDKGEEKKTDE